MQTVTPSGFRLSPQQRYLWQQQQSNQTNYRLVYTVLVQGPLQRTLLQEAIRQIVQRYEILRTTFTMLPGMSIPVQTITESSYAYEEIILDDEDERSQELRIEAVLGAELGISLRNNQHESNGRMTVFSLGAQRHLLLLSASALCADQATMHFLIEEIWKEYHVHLLAGPAVERDDVVQYADLAEGLNELVESPETEAGRLFWAKQMAEIVPEVAFPFLRCAVEAESHSPVPSQFSFAWSDEAILAEFASRQGVSISTLLLTCWGVVLSRLTGQQKISVGVALDCRKFEELERAFGPLTTDVPLVLPFDETVPAQSIVQNVEASLRQGMQWAEYFSWELSQNGNLSADNHASFSFAFTYSELPDQFDLDGLTVGVVERRESLALARLRLSCQRSNQGLRLILSYDPASYDELAMQQLADQFSVVLQQVLEDPEIPMHTITMLSSAAREQLLVTLNATDADYSNMSCLHQLFEEQAQRTPQHTAVILGEQQLTYSELETRANAFAYTLSKHGIGLEDRVAVSLEPSLELVVALLGILKVGAAYVPIDPTLPLERARYLFDNAQAKLLVTRQHFLKGLSHEHIAVLCLDDRLEDTIGEGNAYPHQDMPTEALAYVLYTSGSTGRPKGVMVSHLSVCNRLLWSQHCYPLTTSDRVLQSASFGFDFSVWEFFAPLIAGAAVVMVPGEDFGDSRALVRLIANQRVTVAHFVPSLLALVLEDPAFDQCTALRLVLSGGEVLPHKVHERFFECSEATLYNQYGPTEATIDATYWPCTPGASHKHISIGRPIANTQVYVLDADLQPMPVGVPGELYIGGAGLARGYFQNPDLTAEQFIPDPFSTRKGARLYHTGDRARYLPDHTLEFIGRSDSQVKLRGMRIETGEIEFHLRKHPAVLQAIVQLCDFPSGEKQLVAYVVLDPHQTVSTQTGRIFLQQFLPEYMLPTLFIVLKHLPLLPSGKIDLQALPQPGQALQSLDRQFVAPRTDLERVLVGVFADILEVKQIGLQENFFEFGGHSLLATKVITRIYDIFRVELSLRSFFDTPTVAGLATLLVQQEPTPGRMEKVAYLYNKVQQMSPEALQEQLRLKKAKDAVHEQ